MTPLMSVEKVKEALDIKGTFLLKLIESAFQWKAPRVVNRVLGIL